MKIFRFGLSAIGGLANSLAFSLLFHDIGGLKSASIWGKLFIIFICVLFGVIYLKTLSIPNNKKGYIDHFKSMAFGIPIAFVLGVVGAVIFHPASPQSGLFAVFITAPAAAIVGAIIDAFRFELSP